jgi:hypothetical protein
MFEIVIPPNVDGSPAGNGGTGIVAPVKSEDGNAQIANDAGVRKILLPRRAGEPRFGPQPYYYEASRSGVVPGRYAAAMTEAATIREPKAAS